MSLFEKPQKYHLVVNAESGVALKKGCRVVAEMARQTLRDKVASLSIVQAGEVDSCLKKRFREASPNSVVLVCSGDGTLRTAAQLGYERNQPFAIVPGGTYNITSRNLGLGKDILETFRMYDQGNNYFRPIDVSTANDKVFISKLTFTSGFDVVPKLRQAKIDKNARAVFNAFNAICDVARTSLNTPETYKYWRDDASDGPNEIHSLDRHISFRSNCLLIANDHLPRKISLRRFFSQPHDMQSGHLSVVGFRTKTALDVAKILSGLVGGNWSEPDAVHYLRPKSLIVEMRDHNDQEFENLGPSMRASVDGEAIDFPGRCVTVTKHPDSLRILVPECHSTL